ncbi:MAG: TatD family hydrolase [Raoultibacter sp.]
MEDQIHSEEERPVFRDACFRMKKKGKLRFVEPPLFSSEVRIADTHAHLDLLESAPLSLARCAVYGVGFVVAMADISENPALTFDHLDAWYREADVVLPELVAATVACIAEEKGSEAAGVFALQHPSSVLPHVRIAIGCHPHNAKDYNDALEADLLARLHDPRVCAIGEVGLDYHYDFSPREVQRAVFRRQIKLAHETGLPLILHLREAHEEALAIMEQEGFPEKGVLLHCFNLDARALKPWVDAGCFIAIGGPVTFKKSDYVREAVSLVARNRLLTETDSPYMTPEPLRGMECGPEHTIFTAAALSDAYGCSDEHARTAFLQDIYQGALDLLDREPTVWQRNI